MTENEMKRKTDPTWEERVQKAQNFLCGYQLCLDMLELRGYERKRTGGFRETCNCEDVLMGNEAFWHARMYEVGVLLSKMKNGREKLILYYHYVRGERIESAANLLGLSRRTAYRIHQKGLYLASFLLEEMKIF